MLRKTIFFLILLRLAIGWHFFFEGWHKLHSYFLGTTETSKPFSSEVYFLQANGPIGRLVRAQIGEPDARALDHLSVRPVPEGKDPHWVPDSERIPPALGREMDEYLSRFEQAFKLDEEEKKQAESKTAEAKTQIIVFLTSSVTGGQKITEYRAKLKELHDLSDSKTISLGRDRDNKRITTLKGEVDSSRKEALAELDKEVAKVQRDELSAIVKKKLAKVDPSSVPKGEDAFQVLLAPPQGDSLPQSYEKRWDEYFALFQATYPLTDDQAKTAEAKLNTAKALTAAWLAGKQTIPPSVLFGQLGSPEPSPLLACASVIAAREGLLGDAREQSEQMKGYLNAALTEEQAKGAPAALKAEPTAFLRWLDRLTMWGLLVMGGCLLLGLLTRTNCVLTAGFLLMTYLTFPPFPWVAAPPNNEGNYLFVNKNLVEMLALLVLATTESGRWFGLDALLHRLFHREKPVNPSTRPKARAA